MMTTVCSLVLSSAVNYAQLHISHTLPLFIPHLQSVVYHSLTSNCLYLQLKMSEMYVTLLSHICLYMYLYIVYCCVPVMPFRKLPLRLFLHFSHLEISRGQYVASLLLPFFVQYSLSSFPSHKAGYFLMGCLLPLFYRTKQPRLLPNLGFPCWLMKKHFHDFFISFTAIKGRSLELFLPSIFFFFVLPSQTTLESNHAHLFQMEIILRLQDTNPSECVDRSSL